MNASESTDTARWQITEVRSPNLETPTQVVAARNIPTSATTNRLQTFNLYLPLTPANRELGKLGSSTRSPCSHTLAPPRGLPTVHLLD